MSHTSAIALLIGGVIGGVVGWAGEWLLVASGIPALIPPYTWGAALAALGAILLALAWPIRTQVRAERVKTLVDPFYATRVVLLAKAGALAGSALGGMGVGFVLFFANRPVVLAETLVPTIVAIVGAVVLTVGALIAERWCTLPPDSPDGGPDIVPGGELS
jgi:hypothetical protein